MSEIFYNTKLKKKKKDFTVKVRKEYRTGIISGLFSTQSLA